MRSNGVGKPRFKLGNDLPNEEDLLNAFHKGMILPVPDFNQSTGNVGIMLEKYISEKTGLEQSSSGPDFSKVLNPGLKSFIELKSRNINCTVSKCNIARTTQGEMLKNEKVYDTSIMDYLNQFRVEYKPVYHIEGVTCIEITDFGFINFADSEYFYYQLNVLYQKAREKFFFDRRPVSETTTRELKGFCMRNTPSGIYLRAKNSSIHGIYNSFALHRDFAEFFEVV